MFPLAEKNLRDLIDLSFNSNYDCSCLENNELKKTEDFMNEAFFLFTNQYVHTEKIRPTSEVLSTRASV